MQTADATTCPIHPEFMNYRRCQVFLFLRLQYYPVEEKKQSLIPKIAIKESMEMEDCGVGEEVQYDDRYAKK